MHANNTIDTQANDPNSMRRPGSLTTARTSGAIMWATGSFAFDGAGNVTGIGTAWFEYSHILYIY